MLTYKIKKAGIIILLQFIYIFISAQENIKVDANIVIKDVSNHPVGINMDYLMDDDTYLNPAIPVSTSLKNMGVKFLRFPGGEKSDNYFWGQFPYTSANHCLALVGSCYWPSGDSRFAMNDHKNLKSTTLNFDEFMNIVKAIGAEPLIVVNGDGFHNADTYNCNGVPDRDSCIRVAKEWVRYANVTNNYKIKYWMIGNESFNSAAYDGKVTASQYKDDLIAFAQAMKSVDSAIKIIANGNDDSWWQTVLQAAPYIDYLGLSQYPVWNWTNGYNDYLNAVPGFNGIINTAINALNNYATPPHNQRIKIIITEFNSINWGAGWADTNDVGHAIVAFDIFGNSIINPKVEFSCFWTTRWVAQKTNDLCDAVKPDGNLYATGKALSIWGNFLLDNLINTSSTSKIISYASKNSDSINIFLINKDTVSHIVNLTVKNFSNTGIAVRYVFKGTSVMDVNPSLNLSSAINSFPGSSDTLYSFLADPASITVLLLKSPATLINKQSFPLDIKIFPNPVYQNQNIKVLYENKGPVHYKITNCFGKSIIEGTLNSNSEISTSGLLPGFYLMEVFSNNFKTTKKILVLK